MFLVSDNPDQRHKYIWIFLNDETATVAVILADNDFECSVRRAILAKAFEVRGICMAPGATPTKWMAIDIGRRRSNHAYPMG